MPRIVIGPCRIADATGTHEPGTVLDKPSQDLIDLADKGTKDPESGRAYAKRVNSNSEAAPAIAPEKAPQP